MTNPEAMRDAVRAMCNDIAAGFTTCDYPVCPCRKIPAYVLTILAALAPHHAREIAAAVAAEREACAQIARDGCLVPPDGGSPTEDEVAVCDRIAAAIRARAMQESEG